jgi:hypothetical protein
MLQPQVAEAMMNYRSYLFVSALLALLIVDGAAQEIFKREEGLYATKEIILIQPAGTSDRVVVRSAADLVGRLNISVAPKPEVKIRFIKQAKTGSRSKAVDYIDLISVSLNILPDGARVEMRAPNPPPWNSRVESGMVEAELTVPEGSAIEIEATYFDVTARGPFRSVVIPSSLGRLDISGVEELLDVTTANRRVSLDSISGKINAVTSNSSLLARAIRGSNEQARFRNDGGDIRIDGFVGSINAKNSFGRITVVDFEPRGQSNFIRGSSAPIMLEINRMTEGQLVISNRHEDIDITVPETLSAFFSLAVDEDGVIEATDLRFRPDLVQRDRLYLLTGDGSVDISGSIRGKGNIFVRGTSVEE